jgi:UDP:flavonoid glycosyltransferase YjiC (YdhE family)
VSDILTLAPTLAAEVAGVPHATLIPHVYPVQQPGMPMYSLGLRPPRTPLGRVAWRLTDPLLAMGLRRGRDELNETRARLGLAPVERFHGGISELLAIVGTFPQLEYPRAWPDHVQVTGPLLFELPGEEMELPHGDGPLVLIAPSTSQDPECELLRVAFDGLADEPVRVLATTNRHRPERPIEVPGNAVLVDWMLYSQAMPAADVVVCHGGHGTIARALSAGTPLLVCPSVGDMGENAARVAWSGTGLSVPRRLLSARSIRLATRRLLGENRFAARACEIAARSESHEGAARAADLVEQTARNATSRLSPARVKPS